MKESHKAKILDFKHSNFLVIDSFLNDDEFLKIKNNAESFIPMMKPARVGEKGHLIQDQNVRGDLIHWLDPDSSSPAFNSLFNILREIQSELNKNFFMGICDFESHLALYQKESFYKQHLDRHQRGSTRLVTYIYYLNLDWKKGDGGELALIDNGTRHLIDPIGNRLILFLSDKIPHEVLMTNKNRMSITGWFHEKRE